MSEMTIEVQSRDEEIGSAASRRLRRSDMIPAVVYGGDRQSRAIKVPRRALIELLKKAGRENAVFLLKLAGSGQQRNCMVKELEVDPISREIIHVDFLRIDMASKVQISVHVEVQGEPVGVHDEGGVLDFVNRELEISCLPGDIPRQLEVDVSGLHIGQHVAAGDVRAPRRRRAAHRSRPRGRLGHGAAPGRGGRGGGRGRGDAPRGRAGGARGGGPRQGRGG